jgi:hypothetical protein
VNQDPHAFAAAATIIGRLQKVHLVAKANGELSTPLQDAYELLWCDDQAGT